VETGPLEPPELTESSDAERELSKRRADDAEDSVTATLGGPTPSPRSAPPPRLQEGELIAARYRVEELLGRGGFGEVYRVADSHHGDAPRALKLHRLGRRAERALVSIKAEFALLRTLDHPNLARVHEFGYVNEATLSFFTQDLVRGEDLDTRALELGAPETLDVLAQLLRALAYLHARDILHGDVKPSNVLVDDEGHLTLLDFGIARAFGPQDDEHLVGTHAYVAPEIVAGRPADARADLYSLGIVLFRLACGEHPYRAVGRDLLYAHLYATPRKLPDEVPAPLAALIRSLLEKEPEARPSSAADALEALAEAYGREIALETPDILESALRSTRLVGGEEHVAALAAGALDPGRPIFVIGRDGTGKSRILREAQHRAQLDGAFWVGLRAHAGEGEGIVDRLARTTLTRGVVRRLGDEDRRTLARAHPGLLEPGEKLAPALDPEREHALRLRVLGRALALRFRKSGALVIDDAHHLDDVGIRVLRQIFETLPPGVVQIVLAGRPSSRLTTLVGALDAERRDIPSLTPEDAWELASALVGEPRVLLDTPLADVIDAGRATGRWLEVVLQHAVETGTLRRDGVRWEAVDVKAPKLRSALEARLGVLDEETRRRALLLGVLGRPCSVAELSEALGEEAGTVGASLGALERRAMVRARHELGVLRYSLDEGYAEALARMVPEERLRQAHGRAAYWLALEEDAERLARAATHAAKAGRTEDALVLLRRASREADAAGRPAVALRYLDRAVAATEATDRMLVRRYDLAHRAGMGRVCDEVIDELARRRDAAPPEMRVEIDRRRAHAAYRAGDTTRARRLVTQSLEAVGEGPSPLRAELLHLAGKIENSAGALDTAQRHYAECATVARVLGDARQTVRAELGASLAALFCGRLEVSLASAQAAAAGARHVDDPGLGSDVFRALGNVWRARGELQRARSSYVDAVERARRGGSVEREAKALNNLGTVSQFLGDVLEAEEAYRRSLALKRRAGDALSAHNGHANLGGLLVGIGRTREARRYLERTVEAGPEVGLAYAIALSNLGDCAACDGDFEAALQAYRDAAEHAASGNHATLETHALAGQGRTALLLGRHEEALRATERLEAHARDRQVAEGLRRYLTTKAMWLDACGHGERALEVATKALRVRDRETRYADVFGTLLDARWIQAILVHRVGGDSEAAREHARERLHELADALPVGARRTFLEGHVVHRAILEGELDTPPGCAWV